MKLLTKPVAVIAPGKINLFLNILGKRRDGYHDIQTLFQLIDTGDQITFEVTTENQVLLTDDLVGVRSEDNLIIKSAQLLKKTANVSNGCHIALKKLLPPPRPAPRGNIFLRSMWHPFLTLAVFFKS